MATGGFAPTLTGNEPAGLLLPDIALSFERTIYFIKSNKNNLICQIRF
jgi:hypothetical protein